MHLYGQQFGGVLEKNSFTSSFFGKKCKENNVFEDTCKCFLSKTFSQIKMQANTNWSSHLKNIKHLIFFKRQIFNAIFKNNIFTEIFENHL